LLNMLLVCGEAFGSDATIEAELAGFSGGMRLIRGR
jgi:hypothetical protein